MNIKKTHSIYGSVLSTDSGIDGGLGTLVLADKGGLIYLLGRPNSVSL